MLASVLPKQRKITEHPSSSLDVKKILDESMLAKDLGGMKMADAVLKSSTENRGAQQHAQPSKVMLEVSTIKVGPPSYLTWNQPD